MDDGDDGRGLARWVECQQARAQEGAHRAKRALRHHTARVLLANRVEKRLEIVYAAYGAGREDGAARGVETTEQRRPRRWRRAVCQRAQNKAQPITR